MPRQRRQRRARLGLATLPPVPQTPGAPTAHQWASMIPFGSFVVQDKTGQNTKFGQGDIVIIRPTGVSGEDAQHLPLHKHWVAKIKEIRADEKNIDVWTRVQWYWDGNDVHRLIKSFDKSRCAMYERILSDMYDLVHSSCFSDTTTMSQYNENDLLQPTIEEDCFFTRYTLEYRIRQLEPKPCSTCICARVYNSDMDTMHFCPRPGCRHYYHTQCLSKNRFIEPEDLQPSRPHRMAACSPDTDQTFVLPDLFEAASSNSSTTHSHHSTMHLCTNLEELLRGFNIPTPLLTIAQQPIIKGFKVMSVVGNARSVVQARRMLYKALGGLAPIPDNWEEEVSGPVLDDDSMYNMKPFMCPQCWGPI